MNKLLFVPSVALAGVVAGCSTELLDSQGNPVVDANGKTVMVSTDTNEKVQKSSTVVRENVRKDIEAGMKADGDIANAANVTMSDNEIKRLAGPGATDEEVQALKALAQAEAEKYLKEVVYPAKIAAEKKEIDETVAKFIDAKQYRQASDYLLGTKKSGVPEVDDQVAAYMAEVLKDKVTGPLVESVTGKINPYVKKKVGEGKFDDAREALWRAPLSAGDNVDAIAKIREFSAEHLRTVVNTAEWELIEKEIRTKVQEFVAADQYDEAIEWLKSYRRVRTYSQKLDEKLKTVEAELVKLGVKEENIAPIMTATSALVSEAERIFDLTDVTTNSVTTIEGKKLSDDFAPDLDAYNKRLEEYRELLVRYDCTEMAADGITAKFSADASKLLEPLYKSASYSDGSVETKEFLQLGTAGLNARIDKLVSELIAYLTGAKERYLADLREAAIGDEIARLRKIVEELVAAGKFAEAREEIWKATSTEDFDFNARIREVGVELMLTLVNPTNWNVIESEFTAKVNEATENSSYDEAIAWVAAYPDIRTYTDVLDAKLAAVKGELEALGVKADNIQPVVDETAKFMIEAERLASHTDNVSKTFVKEGEDVDQTKYLELLEQYREALLRNDCTQSNANLLVENFRTKIAPYLIAPGKETSALFLGSNAVNDRLARLRVATTNTLKERKYKYVFTDLVQRVTEAVAAGNYGEARDIVRDVALVEDTEWDARIYATRVGLLNSIVNPNQCAALLKEIDEKKEELFGEKKYEEFREYAKNYEFVHDTYQHILDALEQIKVAMVGLKIGEEDAATYIEALTLRIQTFLESRTGVYTVEADVDLTELEKALEELEKSIVEQYYRPDEVKNFCTIVKQEILSLITKTPVPMTTGEMNAALAARLNMYLAGIDELIQERDRLAAAENYAQMLADIDAEVSFDSQIAMAEDAIAKQLGIKCPEANLKLNAVLGEYARSMRLLKLGKKLTTEQATTLLIGGVYLDQSAVVARALELGAEVNGVSSRDPKGRAALLVAIEIGHNSFLKQLSDASARLDVVDADGNTALHYAVRRGNLAVVKATLAANDVNKVNKAGETALFFAVRKNQQALVSALIAAKVDVSIKNSKGQTAFDAACLAGSRDVLDVLADAGAVYGPEQLIIAASKDRLAVAQWLIGKGVDVNAPGVMEATTCKTDTQCYLVHEGGILKVCEKDCCAPARAPAAAGAAGGEGASGAGAAGAEPKKIAEATGTIKFRVSEGK